MKIIKPHFWYNKSQRNGFFFMLLCILLLQLVVLFYEKPIGENSFGEREIKLIQRQIDSLRTLKRERRNLKVYPFNPNYLSDYKAAQLGLSLKEIDKLLRFKEEDKFINSSTQFQEVTGVSDSLLRAISPLFKFPDWIREESFRFEEGALTYQQKIAAIIPKDLNATTLKDLLQVPGVNEYMAARILSYRNRLQGFTCKNQLFEIWNLDVHTAKQIGELYPILTKPKIKKINVNTATFKEVLSIPYIDYELCKKIFDFRDEMAELQSIEEIRKIEGFPIDKYDRIVLYLEAK